MSKDYLIGKRVRLISNEISDMENDPNPIKKDRKSTRLNSSHRT